MFVRVSIRLSVYSHIAICSSSDKSAYSLLRILLYSHISICAYGDGSTYSPMSICLYRYMRMGRWARICVPRYMFVCVYGHRPMAGHIVLQLYSDALIPGLCAYGDTCNLAYAYRAKWSAGVDCAAALW